MYTEVFNGNYHIRLGKNQQENDTIVRTSPQTALWFHLKDFPSAHAVVTNIVKPGVYDKEVILRAATLVKDNAKQGDTTQGITTTQYNTTQDNDNTRQRHYRTGQGRTGQD